MAAKKISRKQLLREPDEFITTTGKLIQFFNTYRIQILGGFGAVFALLAIIAGYQYYSHRSTAQASTQLAQLQSQYETLLNDGDAPSAYQGVKTGMEELIEKYGRRTSGKIARILLGDYSYRAGQFEDAQGYYEEAAGSFDQGSIYANRLLCSLAYTYLAQGDTAKAREFFEKVTNATGILMADEVLFNLGIITASNGVSGPETKFWEQIVSDHPNSLYMEIAREKSGKPDA